MSGNRFFSLLLRSRSNRILYMSEYLFRGLIKFILDPLVYDSKTSIMVVNGSQTPAKIYLPVFERLASWGFIVVGNDDPQTGNGDTASITLDYVLNESEIKDRVDTNNMGITGYSQGGAGAITAVTKHDNGKLYKAFDRSDHCSEFSHSPYTSCLTEQFRLPSCSTFPSLGERVLYPRRVYRRSK